MMGGGYEKGVAATRSIVAVRCIGAEGCSLLLGIVTSHQTHQHNAVCPASRAAQRRRAREAGVRWVTRLHALTLHFGVDSPSSSCSRAPSGGTTEPSGCQKVKRVLQRTRVSVVPSTVQHAPASALSVATLSSRPQRHPLPSVTLPTPARMLPTVLTYLLAPCEAKPRRLPAASFHAPRS